MAHVNVAQSACQACECQAAAAGDADVVASVFRLFIAAIDGVVKISDGLAQVFVAGHGRVLLMRSGNGDGLDTWGRIGNGARFGGALAEIGPLRIIITKAMGRGFVHDVDDAGAGNEAEAWDGGLFDHGRINRCMATSLHGCIVASLKNQPANSSANNSANIS